MNIEILFQMRVLNIHKSTSRLQFHYLNCFKDLLQSIKYEFTSLIHQENAYICLCLTLHIKSKKPQQNSNVHEEFIEGFLKEKDGCAF